MVQAAEGGDPHADRLALRGRGKTSEMGSFAKARARVFDPTRPRATFADVAGVEEAKQELQEIVEFLKAPERFAALGARLHRVEVGIPNLTPKGTRPLCAGPIGHGSKAVKAR